VAEVRLIRIGYWSSGSGDEWPKVDEFVDLGWDPEERARIVAYLRRGLVARAYMGYSTCRVCGQRNGSVELSDGTYLWPEGLAHYVEQHGVRLSGEFTGHVAHVAACFDDAEIDDTWWRSSRSAPS
jgi:hypothetical protein